MTRYIASVEYNGTNYAGWQRQPFFSATIQETLEHALSQLAAESIETICSGRTDAGVHALRQVVHFDSLAERSLFAWIAGTNRYLPPDIRLTWINKTNANFHARYSAIERNYRYLIKYDGVNSALWHNRCYTHRKFLDAKKMQLGSQFLIGEHDFSAFRSTECQSKTPFRFIREINIHAGSQWIAIDICGNAFLHHMVRNIVGTLLLVGEGKKKPEWVQDVLESKDRRQAGMTSPAFGLYFHGPIYPEQFPQPPKIQIMQPF